MSGFRAGLDQGEELERLHLQHMMLPMELWNINKQQCLKMSVLN